MRSLPRGAVLRNINSATDPRLRALTPRLHVLGEGSLYSLLRDASDAICERERVQ